jgi:hypothetical protein
MARCGGRFVSAFKERNAMTRIEAEVEFDA